MSANAGISAREYLARVIGHLKRWRVVVGRDPRNVPACSLIFFPLHRTVFFCGFAGLLTIKGSTASHEINIPDLLVRLFGNTRGKDMEAFLCGSISPTEYLGGTDILNEMEHAVFQLKGERPFQALFFNPEAVRRLSILTSEIKSFLTSEEGHIEARSLNVSTSDMEIINHKLDRLKDIHWGLERDILENIPKIAALAAPEISTEAFGKYRAINFLLNCIDRLEVRGRDSAGLQAAFIISDVAHVQQVLESLKGKGLYDDLLDRVQDCDLSCGSIHISPEGSPRGGVSVSFTYKTSSIVGELGQNVRSLRQAIASDLIIQEFAVTPAVFATAFTHTRWASVGSITEENCHPINNFTLTEKPARDSDGWSGQKKDYPFYGSGSWSINVLLNGDIDNYKALRNVIEGNEVLIAPEVTTDTKVIPLLIEKYLHAGHDLAESFRLAVNDFEGSHAIVMTSNLEPGKFFLALRGSGQSIYVGITPDRYLFSSELYGLVEGTPFFIKMDGEKPSLPGGGATGQIFILDQDSRGGTSGIIAFSYDGIPIEITEEAVRRAEITTRDIDRVVYPHYFLKEISQSSRSVKKTLRGKYRIVPEEEGRGRGRVIFNLGEDIIPREVREALLKGEIKNITIIGHGTAAVAGIAIADAFNRYLKDTYIRVTAKVASELSGFSLRDDLRDTLVIPITQSGTTTDTNRAVSMAVERGARVIAVVNRRQSDITSMAHGVFYTSDGRDIEMSVASTKAFYSQIVAGHVLALCLAQLLAALPEDFIAQELHNLETAPAMMDRVLDQKEKIRQAAQPIAKQKRHWAVVGSGPNKAAADEIRIKLSELCYKTISSDVVENKKHIDLSAEPLIIVCAAGNPETVMGDIVKDATIFKAHRASVVVFADEGEERFGGVADAVIEIPKAPWPLPVILNTVAGHLWGYYAACSIDEDAFFFREFRDRLNTAIIDQRKRNFSFYEGIADRNFRKIINDFTDAFNRRRSDGSLSFASVKTISDMVLLLKYVVGKLPLEDFWRDFEEKGEPSSPIDLLDIALGHAIDELSRPIDAIRHQAKTVTVGTSRKEKPLQGPIFDLLWQEGFSAKTLTSRNIFAIGRIQPAVIKVTGYTLYKINNLDAEGLPQESSTISISKRMGISKTIRSRTEISPILMGTKKTIVRTGTLYVGQGKSDGASLVIVPLLGEKGGVENLLLCHVDFREDLPLAEKKAVLGDRFNDIRNLINEYNLSWNDRYLMEIPLMVLLGEPAEIIAGQIRQLLERERAK